MDFEDADLTALRYFLLDICAVAGRTVADNFDFQTLRFFTRGESVASPTPTPIIDPTTVEPRKP